MLRLRPYPVRGHRLLWNLSDLLCPSACVMQSFKHLCSATNPDIDFKEAVHGQGNRVRSAHIHSRSDACATLC